MFLSLFDPSAVAGLTTVASTADRLELYGQALFIAVVLLPVAYVILTRLGYERWFDDAVIENIPTAKANGVTMGLVQVEGEVVVEEPLEAPLTGTECVYYSYSISELHDRGDDSISETVERGSKTVPFRIRDDSGSVLIDLDGAESFDIETENTFNERCRKSDPMYYELGPEHEVARSRGIRDFKENVLRDGIEVLVVGTARVHESDDGGVEPVIEPGGEIFTVSRSGEEGAKSLIPGCQAMILVVGAMAFSCAFPSLIFAVAGGSAELFSSDHAEGFSMGLGALACLAAPLLYGGVLAAGYAKYTHDRLVDLRNREERAWSMIEVELQRRRDLIPRLVEIVEAVAEHEENLLETVCKRGASVELPGTPGDQEATRRAAEVADEQTDSLQQLFTVGEQYPELKSHQHFEQLIEELERCEQRIDLARRFYNDSVKRLRSIAGSVPERYVAARMDLPEQSRLTFRDFERKPIELDFSTDGDREIELEDRFCGEAISTGTDPSKNDVGTPPPEAATGEEDDPAAMGTVTKGFIGMIAVVGLFGVACCTAAVTAGLLGELSEKEDPEAVEQMATEIAEFELPDYYEPEVAYTIDLIAMMGREAVYEHETADATVSFSETTVRIGPDAAEMRDRFGDTDPTFGDEDLVVRETEIREFEIRGEVVDVEFSEAEGKNSGKGFRHVDATFPAPNADLADFSATVAEEDYDEREIVDIIESIE